MTSNCITDVSQYVTQYSTYYLYTVDHLIIDAGVLSVKFCFQHSVFLSQHFTLTLIILSACMLITSAFIPGLTGLH